jgi:hypothetical protein
MKKAKFSMPMIALAIITLTLSSYGLFRLAYDFGDVPAALAIMVIAAFDLFAVAAGAHAMTIARDGDSAGFWNLAVVGAAVLSAVLQYAHTQLAGQPWAVGVMMAMFPIATVSLFEGTLRRSYRLEGRATGRVAEPRASFELLQWFVCPRATWRAFRRGIIDRTIDADALFKMGYLEVTRMPETYQPPKRRQLDMSWDQIVPGMALTSGLHSGPTPEPPGESADPAPVPRSIRSLVRESVQVRGADAEAIIADVQAASPGAREDTIRREIRKASGLRSA